MKLQLSKIWSIRNRILLSITGLLLLFVVFSIWGSTLQLSKALDRGNYRIGIMDLERGTLQVLSEGKLDESPAFAPNGQTLIYAAREGSQGVLATVSADGQIRGRIASADGDVREPVWSPFPPN